MKMKPENVAAVYRKLHARGVTTSVLAERLCTSRAHVSLVLAGKRRKGRTWDRVKRELEPEEIALLESGESSTRHNVPCGTVTE